MAIERKGKERPPEEQLSVRECDNCERIFLTEKAYHGHFAHDGCSKDD
jgi:hypothetical protein